MKRDRGRVTGPFAGPVMVGGSCGEGHLALGEAAQELTEHRASSVADLVRDSRAWAWRMTQPSICVGVSTLRFLACESSPCWCTAFT